MAGEVEAQPKALASMLGKKLRQAPSGSLLVGAGDSYASALAAQYLSRGRVTALDPYFLIACPNFAEGKEVYFITISGRTKSNIAAARAVRRMARRTVAVTSDPTSLIGGATNDAIELPYTYVPRIPGTLSSTLSLLTAVKLASAQVRCDFSRVFSDAKRSPAPTLSAAGTTYFLANGPAHVAALYSSLKVFEILGGRAAADLVEEFAHASLFSLRSNDAINIMAAFDPACVGKKLALALRRDGYTTRLIPDKGRNEFESVFHAIFSSQLGILREAKSRRIEYPYILRAGKKLGLSDSMIY